ncbi:MAG: glucose 1-dehydrogenase [Thermomicrobiales bacterium]|jgi:NAD(P)-dependent dehydrogenase (short-subunit alcohol dehydrogenase family)|nr:glucose 1-dehydrogenase [Thermomicrobiales bacterium]
MGALEGKKALVTGAGIGIGQGIARELASQGAVVVLHYAASRTGADAAAAGIVQSGGKAMTVGGDLRHTSECVRVVDEAAALLGGLDILVNNAGVTRSQSIEETTEELFDEMFDLNIKGYFFCAKQALTYLPDRTGAILNITSVHGAGGFPNHTGYAATKGAVVMFTKSLAIELAPRGIRVNAIGPGVVEVPRYAQMPNYTRESGNRSVPLGRVGTPEDIGAAAAFLVSDAASWVTGDIMFVDGGTTARMGLSLG